MDFLLKASGLVIILFLFYYIFLRNETFFRSIRSYFMAGLLIVVSIPLIEIPVYIESIAANINTLDFQEISSTPFIEERSFDWIQIFTYIYLFGVGIFSIKFLIQLISLGFLLSKHQLIKQGSYYYVETSKNVSPFSFFTIIIYNKSQFSIDELEQIINHEKAHVLQWHSVDTILAHLLVITLWFNPFVWLYKKAVQQNLEFLADAYAIELANNQKHYQLTLLKTCNGTSCTEHTNNFYNSLIKKRIIMLHKNKSSNNSQWKYVLLIPLLMSFVFTFNTKIIAQEKKLIKITEKNEVIALILDKNTTSEGLDNIKARFKEDADINLSFKKIKRNANNEITAIKIVAKGKDVSAQYTSNSSEPIQHIKISYDSGNNSISIGNLGKAHESHYAYTIHEKDDKHPHVITKKHGNHVCITTDGSHVTCIQSGDKSKNTELKIIDKICCDGEHVWVHKKDKGKKVSVEVIEIKEGGGEKMLVLHKEGDKAKKHTIRKKGDFMFIGDGDEEPLIYIDGKESTNKEMKDLNKKTIDKIEVLKGEKAVEKYGDKAKDGVIIITTEKE